MKNYLSFLLKLLISGGILLYLFAFSGIVDVAKVIQTLRKTHLLLFIAVFLLCLSTVFLSALRWSLFLPQTIPYSRLVSLLFIGYFFNTFLPGRLGGEVIRTFYIYRDIGKSEISIASVIIDKYLGFSAIATISFLAYLAGFSDFRGTGIAWIIPVSCGIFVLASISFWGLNWGRIKSLSAVYGHIVKYRSRMRPLFSGLLISCGIQIINITAVYMLSLAIGMRVPPVYFFIFVPVINAVTAIPITIAGLGLREVSFAALFGMFFTRLGVTSDEAISLSMLFFASTLLVNLIGSMEYLRIRRMPLEKRD